MVSASLLSACENVDDLVDVDSDEIMRLAGSSTSLPADGASTVTLIAKIPEEATARVVTFKTTAGTFIGASADGRSIDVKADPRGRAQVDLRSLTRTGEAQVVAEIASVVGRMSITFTHALPESLALDAGSFALKASFTDSATITATLRRTVGVPTEGTVVTFSAEDPNGISIGRFRSLTTSDTGGKATALFSAGPVVDPNGTPMDVILRGVVVDPNGGASVQGSAVIRINPP
jgi:hypothetical protein